MTISKERMEELAEKCGGAPDRWLVGVHADELRHLLSAYRTREAALAECEAWRACHDDPSCDAMRDVQDARSATDAARREEGQ